MKAHIATWPCRYPHIDNLCDTFFLCYEEFVNGINEVARDLNYTQLRESIIGNCSVIVIASQCNEHEVVIRCEYDYENFVTCESHPLVIIVNGTEPTVVRRIKKLSSYKRMFHRYRLLVDAIAEQRIVNALLGTTVS